MRVALVRGPYLRPNGVLPWEYIHNKYDDMEIVAFESAPPRFDSSVLQMPVRKLHWLDGKLRLFGYDHFISEAISKMRLPSNVLLGMERIAHEFDVIHVSENYHAFSFQGAFWSKIWRKKFVFSAGENIPYPLMQRNFITWQVKRFVNSTATKITATTPLGKRTLIHEGVEPQKIEIIPNALDFAFFERYPKDSSRTNLPEELNETFNILFVGRLGEQKGIEYLLRAFQSLKGLLTDVRLILIGDNYLPPDLYETYVQKDKDVYHIEHVPNTEIQHVYNLCDVVILPSVTLTNNEEQFGMAILEAMACSKPTIVTDVGGMPYVAKHGETSLIIPERSEGAISEAVMKLYSNLELRERLGQYSYSYVRENFSKEIVGRKLYEFYREIASLC